MLSLLLILSGIGAAAQETSAPALPETGKISAIAVGYSQGGEFSRFLFAGEDGRSHHWLEVWKLKNTSNPSVVNYVMQPRSVIVWGRGPILADAFHRQCFPRYLPKFEEKDYWVATPNGLELQFVRLDKEEDQNNVKGVFSNLQAAATQSRAGGLLDTRGRASLWESNIISRFQKGKRKWINPEWVQTLNICIRIPSLK